MKKVIIIVAGLLIVGCGDSEREIAQEKLLYKALDQFNDVTVMRHSMVHIDGGGELEARITCSFMVSEFRDAKFAPVEPVEIFHNEPLGKATCDIAKAL
jgi:hypothetical protein